MNLPSKDNIIQFIKFGIVGVSNTFISLFIYYIFLWINKDLYMVGNIAGFIVSVSNSFFWNNRYVFRSDSHGVWETLKKLLRTYVSYGSTFLLSSAMLFIEIDILKLSEVISPIINLMITVPLNFIINKFWTFKK